MNKIDIGELKKEKGEEFLELELKREGGNIELKFRKEIDWELLQNIMGKDGKAVSGLQASLALLRALLVDWNLYNGEDKLELSEENIKKYLNKYLVGIVGVLNEEIGGLGEVKKKTR